MADRAPNHIDFVAAAEQWERAADIARAAAKPVSAARCAARAMEWRAAAKGGPVPDPVPFSHFVGEVANG
jgi:hypothetical protein